MYAHAIIAIERSFTLTDRNNKQKNEQINVILSSALASSIKLNPLETAATAKELKSNANIGNDKMPSRIGILINGKL